MSVPLTHFLSLQRVPDVAVEVVVAGEDEAARVGQRQGCDSSVQAGVLVANHLLVGAQVVHLAAAVVGACDDGVPAGEELQRWRETRHRKRFLFRVSVQQLGRKLCFFCFFSQRWH